MNRFWDFIPVRHIGNSSICNFWLFSIFFIEHTCATPGCGSVLVFDGNCKNYRDVCKARDAGFVEYEGLEGVVKTGCMNTPKLGSRFCELHIQNVSVPQHPDPRADRQEKSSQGGEEGVVAMILGKRDTRSGTYYQVRSTYNSDPLYVGQSLE